MNGDRQMLPVHTIRIRASSPMTEISSVHGRELGEVRGWHGVDRSRCPGPACHAPDLRGGPSILILNARIGQRAGRWSGTAYRTRIGPGIQDKDRARHTPRGIR